MKSIKVTFRAFKATGSGYYKNDDDDLPTNALFEDVDNLHTVFVEFYQITTGI